MAMTARFRSFSFICITSCFILLGLTRLAIAEICTAPGATPDWGLAYSAVYATQTAAAAACSAMLPTLSGISHSSCYYDSGRYYYWIDDYTNHSHYKFGHCACESSNSDGQCDSSVDTDGDGIPDGQDPCPQNPNPDCTDPNDPPDDPPTPPVDPPDIPDEVVVGDCTFDLRSFKEWLNTDSSFPFNLMFRLIELITPLFDLTPEAPVFDISIDASSISGRFSYIPSSISFSWDFTEYDIYAKILRSVEILSIVIAVIAYGLNSNKERP